MNREQIFKYYRSTVLVLGAVCVAYSALNLSPRSFSWGFLFLAAFSVLVAPRMSVVLPRSNIAVGFSDTLTFLAFLFYGPEAAIILAAVETLANCYYIEWKGGIEFNDYMIAFNASVAALAFAFACMVWSAIARFAQVETFATSTTALIASIGVLAISQFLAATVLAALFRSIKYGLGFWRTWKKDCLSSSLSQFVGSGTGAIVFKIINYGDVFAAGVAMVTFVFVYLSYRQSISEINSAIDKVEDAERAKAETERERRREAERHAEQLSVSLEKEERANEALRRSERDLQHAALHDSLTGLANRKNLNEVLQRLIGEYRHNPARAFQVLFLDIRRFKNINDSLGHSVGDKVLSIAAKRFKRLVNDDDLVARIGGDEFAIVLRNLATPAKAQKVARKIYDSITQPFSLGGNRITIDLNIGIAPCDMEYRTPEEILRDADIAMHYAKEKNDGLAVFTRELGTRFLERVKLEMDLRNALDREELSLNYQPIVDLGNGRMVGFEALLRWNHAEAGMIPPNKFIPIAESSGLIQPMTVWILREACVQLNRWRTISPKYRDLMVSVNISGKHLSNDDLIDDVENALAASGLPPSNLKLEITESTAMENAEHTITVLNKLKKLGVQLSLDDFGTGYSSLSYLQRLPFDTLKIDRSFVYSIGDRGENSEIVQTIISLAKNLKMRVIAEGIETVSQLSVLTHLGCDFGQGYLMAKPKGHRETENLLYSHPDLLPFATDVYETEEKTVGDEVVVYS